jgi:hypothetical protein
MTRPVTSVKGIGAAAAATLAKTGINSAEELASMTVEQLSQVPGFSVASATRVIAEAGKMPAVDRAASARPAAGSKAAVAPADKAPQPEPAGKGKNKGKEKGKRKDKGSKAKGSDKQGKATGPEAEIPRKAIILIKVLTSQIESRKAKIAKHRRKLERLEKALREVLVKYHRD